MFRVCYEIFVFFEPQNTQNALIDFYQSNVCLIRKVTYVQTVAKKDTNLRQA